MADTADTKVKPNAIQEVELQNLNDRWCVATWAVKDKTLFIVFDDGDTAEVSETGEVTLSWED